MTRLPCNFWFRSGNSTRSGRHLCVESTCRGPLPRRPSTANLEPDEGLEQMNTGRQGREGRRRPHVRKRADDVAPRHSRRHPRCTHTSRWQMHTARRLTAWLSRQHSESTRRLNATTVAELLLIQPKIANHADSGSRTVSPPQTLEQAWQSISKRKWVRTVQCPSFSLSLPDQQKGRRESEKAAALATELGWGAKHRWPLFLALLGNLNAVSGNYFRNQRLSYLLAAFSVPVP